MARACASAPLPAARGGTHSGCGVRAEMNDGTSTEETQEVALKILHTADWHLGRAFPSFAEADETKLTRARIDAVDRVFGLAESFGVNAVLCAGDLFDDPAPADSWWQGLLRLLERRNWSDRPVFLLP